MSKTLSAERVEGLPKEIATVMNRLSETNKIMAQGFAVRKPEQYEKFSQIIQNFNDGQGEFVLSKLSGVSYPRVSRPDERREWELFAKKIGLKKIDLSGVPVAASGVADLSSLQFMLPGLTYERLEWLVHKYLKPYWEWTPGWSKKINLPKVMLDERQLADVPYYLWHSGQDEAPKSSNSIRMCGKTVVQFDALPLKFMTPAEYIEFVLFKKIMKGTLVDRKAWTMCPRSRWSDGRVPFFYSDDVVFNIGGCRSDNANENFRVRPVFL